MPGELIERAVELGYQALALTDHDGLHGAMEFAQAARSAGLQPITGAEVTLADGSHLTLLAETPQGYANLSRLIAHAHLNSPRLEPKLDPPCSSSTPRASSC
jgi:error-prone DNA polymerase